MREQSVFSIILLLSLLFVGLSCGEDDEDKGPLGTDTPPGRFGEVTSAVVIVNPVINQGSTTTTVPGKQREGIAIEATGIETVASDETGLALLEGLPMGEILLEFESGETSFTVVRDKELYDVVVAVREDDVEQVFPAVRYPIGGQFIQVEAG